MINVGSTAVNSIIGGAIMAFASSLHLYLNGKITGISGAVFRCITLTDFSYNFSFIIGMIFLSAFMKCFFDPMAPPKTVDSPIFMETTSRFVGDLSIIGFMIAGFLVGFGAKMANGCTSGHGVCGLPRLSKRSIVAICLFMIFGILMATTRYYIPFLRPSSYAFNVWETSVINIGMLILSIGGFGVNLWNVYKSGIKDKVRDILVSFCVGCLFSFGLMESGMLQRHVVVEFLTLGKVWNFQLAFVLGTAVGINLFTFNYILKKTTRPKFKENFDLPTNTEVDNKLCVGSAIFGLGWGLAGICPGPAVIACYLYCPQILAFCIFMCVGMYLESIFDNKMGEKINNNQFISKMNRFGQVKSEE